VWELPPNNQGIAALEMLKILEPYDLKAMGHNSTAYLHHLIEAKKLAYADLARYVGDADHLVMPVDRMLSDDFIAERRSHLDETKAQERVDPGPALTSSENPSVVGQALTFTATISNAAATGTVTFIDGSQMLGTATVLSGKASLSTAALTVGRHSITAKYNGDGNFNGSTSAAVSQNVKRK